MREAWWITIPKAFIVINVVMVFFAFTTWLERKLLGRMQLRFGRFYVRTLLDQFRRQADRQILRQPQRGELELLGRLLARKAADQRR